MFPFERTSLRYARTEAESVGLCVDRKRGKSRARHTFHSTMFELPQAPKTDLSINDKAEKYRIGHAPQAKRHYPAIAFSEETGPKHSGIRGPAKAVKNDVVLHNVHHGFKRKAEQDTKRDKLPAGEKQHAARPIRSSKYPEPAPPPSADSENTVSGFGVDRPPVLRELPLGVGRRGAGQYALPSSVHGRNV